ncbi:hypothetical protein DFJ74DRAFT_669801 [Hyaloraphidium curvatum]|nr:hypothetical protein DFJ74DRAFT_669801 [Hyaloraphidium curvatum]
MEDDVGDVSIIRAMVAPHAVPGAAQRLALGFIATFGSYVSAFHAYRHVRTISTRSPLTAMLKLVDYVKRNGFLDNTDVTGRAAPLYRCLAQPQNQENSRLSLAFDSSPPPGQMPLALTSATAPAPVPAPVPEQASFAAESIPPPLALETFLFRTITILHKKVEEAAAGRAAAALARHYGSASAPEGAAVEEHMLRTGWEALTSDYSRLYAQWMIDQSKTHPLYYLINPLRTAGAFETTDFDRSSDSLSMVFVNGETDLATFLRCFHRFDDAKLAVGYPAFGRTPDLDNPPSGHLPAPRAKIDSNRAAAVADSGAVHLPPTPGSYSTTSVRPAPPRDSEQRRLPSAKHTRLLDERLRQADAHMATGSTPLKAQSPVHPKPTPSAASPAAKRVAIEGEQQPAAATPQRRVAMEVDRGGSAATARKFNYPLGGHVPGLSRDESVRRTLQELPAEKLVRSFYMFVKGLTTMGPEPPAGEAAPVAKDKHGHERPHQRPGLFEARSPPAPRIWTLLSKGAWREGAGGLARPFEAGKQLLISQVRVDKLNEVVSTLPKDGDERRRAWCYIWNLRWTGQMLYFTHDFNPTEHLPYRIPPGAAIDQLPTEQAISLRQIKEPITPRVGGQSTTARRRQIFRPYGWRDFDTLRDLLVTVKAVADNDKERLAVDQLTHLIVAVGTNIDAPNSASFLLKKPRTCFVRCLQDYSVPRQVMVPILYLVEKAGIHMGVEFGGQVEVTHECHLCDDPLSTETAKNARLAVPLTADQALDLHHARNHFWVVADGEVARKVKAAASDLVLWSSENVGPWRGALRARNIDVPTGDGAAILGFRNMSSLMLAPLRAGYDVDWLRSGTWQVLGERIVTSFASKRALSHDARLFPALHDTEAWLKVRQIAQSFDGWFKDSDKITFAAALDTTPLLPITDIPRRPTSAGAGNIAATLGQPSSAGSTEPTKEHVVVESSPGPATASPGPAARSRVAATPDPASPTLSGSPSAQECWTEDGACAACGVSKVLVGKTRHRSFCTEKVRRFVSATMRAGRPSSDYEAKISTTAHGRPVQSAVLDHLRHILVREFEAEAHTEKLRKELGLAMGMFQRHWVGERSYVLDTATVSRMATMVASRLQLGHRESRYQTGAGLTAGGDEFAADRKATAVAMYASVKRDFVPMLMRDERASYEERLLSSDLNSVVGEFIRNAKRLAIWETPKDIRKLIRGQVQNAGALFPTKTQNHVCRTIWESLFDFTVITAYRLELGATILLGKVKLAEAATAPRAAAGGGTEAQGGRASRRKRRTYHEDKDDEAENEAEAAADQAESDLGGAQQPAAQADATAAPRVFSDEQVAAAERIRAGILRCLGGEEIARKVFEELKGIARVQYLPVPPWPLRRVLTEEIVAGLAEGYFERHGYEAAAIAAFGPIATQERGRLQGLTDDQLLNEIADEQAQEARTVDAN